MQTAMVTPDSNQTTVPFGETPSEPEVQTPSASPETPAEGQAPEQERNWREVAERAEAELRDMRRQVQRLSSIAGNTRKQAEMEAQLTRYGAMLEALVEHLSEPEPDGAKLKAKQQQIAQQQAGELAKTRNAQVKQGYLDKINAQLRKAGIKGDDPRLENAIALWNDGVQQGDDSMKFLEALSEVTEVVNEAMLEAGKRLGATERQRRNQAEGALTPGSGAPTRPAPPTATPENIDKAYMDWEQEHPDQPNPYEEQYRRMLRPL